MSETLSNFAQNRAQILEKIAVAAKSANRLPNEINLVAACKTQSKEIVFDAIKNGQLIFGENKVQEAYIHFDDEKPNDIELRLIGPLQSNKAQEAVALFDIIETLDRVSLAKEVAKAIQKLGKSPKFLVQVNIGEEMQKSGVSTKDLEGFLKTLRIDFSIEPIGLMCIPPFDLPPAPYFALLAKMARENGLGQLSMGMSGDFESAIKFGATHVRVGTALFGARDYSL